MPRLPEHPLEALAGRKVPVNVLMALAVDERGGPMTYEEIAQRLAAIGVHRTAASLKKAWHGKKPLRLMDDGRLDLFKNCRQWEFTLLKARIALGSTGTHGSESKPLPPDTETPITREELDLAMSEEGRLPSMNTVRRMVVALDLAQGPLTIPQAVVVIAKNWNNPRFSEKDITASLKRCAGPVSLGPDGLLALNPDHDTARKARETIRIAAAKARDRHKRDESLRSRLAGFKEELAAAALSAQERFLLARKGVVRSLFIDGSFAAASVFDPDLRESKEFTDQAAFADHMQTHGMVASVDPLSLFEKIGLEPGDRMIVDLSPPVKGVSVGGRRRPVTVNEVVRATLGRRHELSEDAELKGIFEAGDDGKLLDRLRKDALRLNALLDFGAFQGFVMLRAGRDLAARRVEWNPGRRRTLRELLVQALEEGQLLELVVGGPPGLSDPRSSIHLGGMVGFDGEFAVFESIPFGEIMELPIEMIFSAKPCILRKGSQTGDTAQ